MLIQSMLADKVSLAVTAPKLGGVGDLEMLGRCGLKLEEFITFIAITVLLKPLVFFKNILRMK